MIQGFNKYLAVRPPENKGAERKVQFGVATIAHRHSLTELEVVFGSQEIPAGSIVYVNSAIAQQKWATEVYEIDGEKVVLVSEAMVVLVKNGA